MTAVHSDRREQFQIDSEGYKSAIKKLLEQVSERDRRLSWFRTEQERLKAQLDEFGKIRMELGRLAAERASLVDELNLAKTNITQLDATKRKLTDIERSFGYKVMRFYGSRIDHLLPDGTRRGDFRKAVVESSRIAADKGLRALLHHVREELSRRESKIVTSMPQIEIEPQTALGRKDPAKTPEATEAQGIIVLENPPELSLTEPIKVSNPIVLSGWAVSQQPIREIRVYLDENFVGLASYGFPREDIGLAHPELPDSLLSGFHKLVFLDEFSRNRYRLKIEAQTNTHSVASIEGLLEVEKEIHHEAVRLPTTIDVHRMPNLETTVSVIILTKKPPPDFEQTLERLRGQVDVPDPEIVVVNSGDCDLSSLAAKYRLKAYNISPNEFDHATTRNYAAEKTTGEYLVFLSDDAIPAEDHLLYNMISILKGDSTIAAVTARQIPRSDSGLMYCQAMWGHYRFLGLNRDRIVGSSNVDRLSYKQKRAICQIDDVCSCFRRETFLRYKYAKGYAEDLELGIRLVKDGFRIAQLFSTGVIHSHNRPPSYHMKRSYVDFLALRRLLNYGLIDFERWSVASWNDLVDLILWLYRALNLTIDDLVASEFSQHDIQRAFGMMRFRIYQVPQSKASTKRQNDDLSKILGQIMQLTDYSDVMKNRRDRNPLAEQYIASIENSFLKEYLMHSHRDLRNVETDLVETLYDMLATQAGNILAQYTAYSGTRWHQGDKIASALQKFLSEGV